ncbi:hypothetical protein F4V43_00220 [Paenibacillus spiritus]|uniref:CueP family metal-binding protein n=1 Tax=Paenibacillus spiritus TaxID=2496557 RepID=A0A5J5GJY5_9BACL|nr:CueP family metal-binding protein [Paenibacillus spiritus]KAA9008596.1 hypothetical protein F4V43_00220 [Paenibacillus spiritus]
MNKRMIPMAAAVIAVGAVAYFWSAGGQQPGKSEEAGVLPAGVDIKELVQSYSTGEMKAESASISSTKLVVTQADQSRVAYKLPGDEFFLSIAPYLKETHPCATHNLTGCQGEMADQSFQVKITDHSGRTVVDREMTSYANGFLDLWLPREGRYHVKLEQNGRVAESDLSTFESDDTCVTTMQLK